MLIAETGLRLGEAMRLRWTDLDLAGWAAFHALRHTAGSRWLAAGVPLAAAVGR